MSRNYCRNINGQVHSGLTEAMASCSPSAGMVER